jgi:hypothetical protein
MRGRGSSRPTLGHLLDAAVASPMEGETEHHGEAVDRGQESGDRDVPHTLNLLGALAIGSLLETPTRALHCHACCFAQRALVPYTLEQLVYMSN